MKRIAVAVLRYSPTDAIAMLKETSLASGIGLGMEMERIGAHVITIIVSKLVVVKLRLNKSCIMCLMFEGNKKLNKTFFLFNDCQPKTIGFRVLTINLGHLHG